MKKDNTLLRLDRLTVQNFRCFTDCSIDFHPKLSVLVAENGLGKTAILSAAKIALDVFVDAIIDRKIGKSRGFDLSDIHQVRNASNGMIPFPPTAFLAEGYVNDEKLKWGRTRNNAGLIYRTSTKDLKDIKTAALKFRERITPSMLSDQATPHTLPIVAFYGTDRLWSKMGQTEDRRFDEPLLRGRLHGYLDTLSASSSFDAFETWYAQKVKNIKMPTSVFAVNDRPELHLAAIRKATTIVLEPSGWSNLDLDVRSEKLTVEHSDLGRLPLSFLSDGVRSMVALVANVAYRCVQLNPHFGELAARRTPGILLIDELDMHLHPRWQQRVVELMQRAFPAMQMVFTTHSPHVLSTVYRESIRVIHLKNCNGDIEIPKLQTRGVQSADVLSSIMGIDPIPQVKEAILLSDYIANIEEGHSDDTDVLTMRSKLVAHFGQTHPLILDCDRLIRFQSFKRRKPLDGQE